MDPPSHGLLQDAGSPHSTGRFRPYASTKHRVTRGRYITSNDRRGYIPVYEYPLNGQWIMMDIDDGYILWTGIWKALGNAKADIVKMLESQPDLAPQLRRVRGGYLKIQGTWMPYEVALRLARRVAWTIREDLIPLFGPTFPATCLSPDQPGYGQVLGNQRNQPGKRRGRRAAVPLPLSATLPPPQPSDSDASPGDKGQQTRQPGPSSLPPLSAVTAEGHPSRLLSPSQAAGPSGIRRADEARRPRESSSIVRYSYGESRLQFPAPSASERLSSSRTPLSTPATYAARGSDSGQHHVPSSGRIHDPAMENQVHSPRDRFSPYQNAAHLRHRAGTMFGHSMARPSPVDLPPLAIPSSLSRSAFADESTQAAASSGSVFQPADPSLRMSTLVNNSVATSHRDGPREMISLPPLRMNSPAYTSSGPSRRASQSSVGYSLPPISDLGGLPPPSSTNSSRSRFDSTAVLRRLALDDEEVGASRRASFVSVGDERSHRDAGGVDPDRDMIFGPSQEQLSRRRRSLSEPPFQPDTYPRLQPLGLAMANNGRNSSPSSIPLRYAPSGLIPTQMTSARAESPHEDSWNRSAPSLQSGTSLRSRYNQSTLHSREDLESGAIRQGAPSQSPTSAPRLEASNEIYSVDVIDREKSTSPMDYDDRDVQPQFATTTSTDRWRPHHSRTPTPLEYRANPQAPRTISQSPPESSAYRSTAVDSSHREEAPAILSSSDRRFRDV